MLNEEAVGLYNSIQSSYSPNEFISVFPLEQEYSFITICAFDANANSSNKTDVKYSIFLIIIFLKKQSSNLMN